MQVTELPRLFSRPASQRSVEFLQKSSVFPHTQASTPFPLPTVKSVPLITYVTSASERSCLWDLRPGTAAARARPPRPSGPLVFGAAEEPWQSPGPHIHACASESQLVRTPLPCPHLPGVVVRLFFLFPSVPLQENSGHKPWWVQAGGGGWPGAAAARAGRGKPGRLGTVPPAQGSWSPRRVRDRSTWEGVAERRSGRTAQVRRVCVSVCKRECVCTSVCECV